MDNQKANGGQSSTLKMTHNDRKREPLVADSKIFPLSQVRLMGKEKRKEQPKEKAKEEEVVKARPSGLTPRSTTPLAFGETLDASVRIFAGI